MTPTHRRIKHNQSPQPPPRGSHAGHCKHGRVPLCVHRARWCEPLSYAGFQGDRSRGAANSGLSIGGVEIDHFGLWHDKAGRQRRCSASGGCDRSENWTDVPRSQRAEFGTGSKEPDLARALHIHQQEPAAVLRDQTDLNGTGRRGRNHQGVHGGPALPRPVGSVLRPNQPVGCRS